MLIVVDNHQVLTERLVPTETAATVVDDPALVDLEVEDHLRPMEHLVLEEVAVEDLGVVVEGSHQHLMELLGRIPEDLVVMLVDRRLRMVLQDLVVKEVLVVHLQGLTVLRVLEVKVVQEEVQD